MSMTEYNQKTGEVKPHSIPKENQYKSPLFKEVSWAKTIADADLCWHCQENPRIRHDPDVVIWCQRCYTLHYKKGDGTYIRSYTLGIGKDLQDIQTGKVKPKYLNIPDPSNKVIQDD